MGREVGGGREGERGVYPVMPPGVATVEVNTTELPAEVDCRLEKKKTDLGKRERTRSYTEKKKDDNPP
jgi:hypothetical protein